MLFGSPRPNARPPGCPFLTIPCSTAFRPLSNALASRPRVSNPPSPARAIDASVGRLGSLRRSQQARFDAYKQHELTDAAAHDLLVQVLDARVLPVTKIPLALKEWRTPRHPEFREGGKTAWRLFNAITEAAK